MNSDDTHTHIHTHTPPCILRLASKRRTHTHKHKHTTFPQQYTWPQKRFTGAAQSDIWRLRACIDTMKTLTRCGPVCSLCVRCVLSLCSLCVLSLCSLAVFSLCSRCVRADMRTCLRACAGCDCACTCTDGGGGRRWWRWASRSSSRAMCQTNVPNRARKETACFLVLYKRHYVNRDPGTRLGSAYVYLSP